MRAEGGRHESPLANWGEGFSEQAPAAAILDRLLHHATTVNIKGGS